MFLIIFFIISFKDFPLFEMLHKSQFYLKLLKVLVKIFTARIQLNHCLHFKFCLNLYIKSMFYHVKRMKFS